MKKIKTKDYKRLEKVVEEEQEQAVVVELTNDSVLRRQISWDNFAKAGLINEADLNLISRFDKKPSEEREFLLNGEGGAYAHLFIKFVSVINNLEAVQYTLAIIDEILNDEHRLPLFLELTNEDEGLPFAPLLSLLGRQPDIFVAEKASKIVALLMTESQRVNERDVQFFCKWSGDQLRKTEPAEILVGVSALQILLRKNRYRLFFHAEDGIKLLAAVLRDENSKPQVIYLTLYCMWLLSFHEEIAPHFPSVSGLIPHIIEVIRRQDRPKIRRVALATLRNLLGKGDSNEQMLRAGALRLVTVLSQKKWGDVEIEEDLKVLNEELEKDMDILNSFEMYKQEVESGNLTWSPVHRSEKFWKENISHFEENNFKTVGQLLDLIRTSVRPTVLAVACYDLGEFVRFHPRGRRELSKREGKVEIMKLLSNPDEEVQKHALLCIQKMMVHNWEYLSKGSA